MSTSLDGAVLGQVTFSIASLRAHLEAGDVNEGWATVCEIDNPARAVSDAGGNATAIQLRVELMDTETRKAERAKAERAIAKATRAQAQAVQQAVQSREAPQAPPPGTSVPARGEGGQQQSHPQAVPRTAGANGDPALEALPWDNRPVQSVGGPGTTFRV
eukprot:3283981-Rhodomonas_salina.3